MPPDPITSPANPRVKRVARLRDRRQRDREGVFVAEGSRDVERALAAGLRAVEVYATDGRPDATAVSGEAMRRMSYRQSPPDVLAVFETPRRTLDDLPAGELYLVAVGTEKPGNLGAMARTAAAAGCAGVIAAGADVDWFNPNAIRNSTGAVFSLPCVACDEPSALAWLRARPIHTLATVASDPKDPDSPKPRRQPRIGATPLWDAEVPDVPLAVVVGPEHEGLPPPWLDAADLRVTVPIAPGPIDSLNAATAAAVVLFELARRRRRAYPDPGP